MNQPYRNSPWMSLVILLGLTLVCAFVFQFAVVLIGMFFSDNPLAILEGGGNTIGENEGLGFMYALLGVSLIGTFLIPSLILQRIEPYFKYFLSKDGSNARLYLLAVLLLFVFGPAMQWIAEANAGMTLPESLRSLEDWMRRQEDSMAMLTEKIVMIDSWTLLFVNLFVMAVVPAIAEEFYFRGSLMHIVQRITKNYHLTVWLTAIIFSFIHFQFYGFLPRMILGVFFGYMFVWSQNIWISVLAHFMNNASVTIIAFYYTRQGKTYEELQSYDSYSIFVYLGSIILTIAIAYLFYIKSHHKRQVYGEGLDKNHHIL